LEEIFVKVSCPRMEKGWWIRDKGRRSGESWSRDKGQRSMEGRSRLELEWCVRRAGKCAPRPLSIAGIKEWHTAR
jgi:hypothetical protein